jgi:hypothetical protein
MPELEPHTHEHDAHDADGVEPERTAADHGNHAHTHADGTTHAHPAQGHARRPGFLARLFGAPG